MKNKWIYILLILWLPIVDFVIFGFQLFCNLSWNNFMVFIIKIISGFFASLTGVCATMYFYKKAESFDVKNNIKLLLFGAGLVAHVFLELSDFNNKDIAIKIIIIIISLAAALAYGHFVSKIYLYSIFIQNKAFDYIPDYDFNKVEEEVKRMTNTTINGQKFNLKGRKSKK